MKIIAIGGMPCTGKSYLVKSLREKLAEMPESHNWKTCHAELYRKYHLTILGKYSKNDVRAGTDQLNTSVQPDAVDFLKKVKKFETEGFRQQTIIFEGDRLFNLKFLDQCQELAELKIIILEASQADIQARYIARGGLSDLWLQGRAIKIQNIKEKYSGNITFSHSGNTQLLLDYSS
jgi:hypothetical protein